MESVEKTWVKVYPSYIDKELKHSEGRKVSAVYAVDKPTVQEIYIICKQLFGLDCSIEGHHHPKDWLKRGRVLIRLKENNKSVSTDITNSKFQYFILENNLLKKIGEAINSNRVSTDNTPGVVSDDSKRKKRNKK